MDPQEIQQLINDVRRVFKDTPRGSGTTICEARAMDDYEPEAVQRSARALDGEARWQDISDEKIVKYYDAFTFLNAEGMRYYVAPFLLYDLAHPDSVWGVGEVVLGYLNWKRRLVDYEILNDEQKAILARYLKMRSERSDDPVYASEAKNALSVYWHAYLP